MKVYRICLSLAYFVNKMISSFISFLQMWWFYFSWWAMVLCCSSWPQPCSIVKDDYERLSILLYPPKNWGYRNALSCIAQFALWSNKLDCFWMFLIFKNLSVDSQSSRLVPFSGCCEHRGTNHGCASIPVACRLSPSSSRIQEWFRWMICVFCF